MIEKGLAQQDTDNVRTGLHWQGLQNGIIMGIITGTHQRFSGAASITTGGAPALPSALAIMAKPSVLLLECPSAVGMDATSARKNGPQTADA